MMNNLLSDIGTAVNLFKDMRKTRKEGREIEVQKVMEIPIINLGAGFLDTVEGCVFANCSDTIYEGARAAFNKLPYEEKHRLSFSPQNGEFVERFQYWKELLKPCMSNEQCKIAMNAVLRWYIHIKRQKLQMSECHG